MLSPTDKSTQETVLAIDWWTDSLFCLTISRPALYHFVPGQFSRLGLLAVPVPVSAPVTDPDTVLVPSSAVLWRAYSITSATQDKHLEYYGIVVPGGAFTSAVRQLEPGAPILLEKAPNGFLTADRFTGGEDLWMLATGTGLGPYIALLRDAAIWRRFKRLVLVHGVRHAPELAYRSQLHELAALAANQPAMARMHIVQATTRDAAAAVRIAAPAELATVDGSASESGSHTKFTGGVGKDPDFGWPRLQGRITTLLASGELEAAVDLKITPDASRIMLCGNPAMIDETRRLLQQRALSPVRRAIPGHFLTENYW